MKIKKTLYLSPEADKILTEIKEENAQDSYGSTIEFLIHQYQQSNENHSLVQAQIISQLVTEEVKETLDILRRRTVFIDDSLKILLHMLNDTIIQRDLDIQDGMELFSYSERPSQLYSIAKQAVSKEKQHYKEQALLRHQNRGENS